jgi:hypothetical protein
MPTVWEIIPFRFYNLDESLGFAEEQVKDLSENVGIESDWESVLLLW